MKKVRNYSLSKDLLNKYIQSSLTNAGDLIADSTILLSQKRYPRSYYLSCASIEETGKAYSAFFALGRNLENPGTVTKIKSSFEDHFSKIMAGMISLLMKGDITKIKQNVDAFSEIAQNILIGREKSMYVDVNEKQEVTMPTTIVRPEAAVDALRLSKSCFEVTSEFIQKNEPPQSTAAQDKFMFLNTKKLTSLISTQNFWEFCIDQKQGKASFDLAEMSVKYYDEYYSKKTLYAKKLTI